MQAPQIADQLRAMAASGTRVPGFRGKVMVDIESLNRLSEQLGNVDMSDDVREASEVIRMKESILNQAYLEAKRIRTGAEDEAGKADEPGRERVPQQGRRILSAEAGRGAFSGDAGAGRLRVPADSPGCPAQGVSHSQRSRECRAGSTRRRGQLTPARCFSTSKSSLPTFSVRCGAASTRSTSKSRRASVSSSRMALPSTAQPLQPMALPSLN